MDMPRSSFVSDKVGYLAVRIADKRITILANEIELNRLKRDLREIETAVDELDPFRSEIVRRYYFHKERWESICVRMRIRKSRFYEILAETLDVLGNQL